MMEELKLTVDTGDLIALVEKRYAVTLEESGVDNGKMQYSVAGLPLAVAKIHGAIRRAHKAQK